ncbi:MAG: 5' nucleotidase, NT5C type [Candidatus Saccharibacteria bacterium]
MQKKQIIAFDIDDVLAKTAEGFTTYSNAQWGTTLLPSDFSEDWINMWQVAPEEMLRRSKIFHGSDVVLHYEPNFGAVAVLDKLRTTYDLRLATSRQHGHKEYTSTWIDAHFPEMFNDIHYSGIFDDDSLSAHKRTKADLLEEIGATYLIDDQLKHCIAAAERGIKAVLFGDYTWNQADVLPPGVHRCATWKEVAEYFDEQS